MWRKNKPLDRGCWEQEGSRGTLRDFRLSWRTSSSLLSKILMPSVTLEDMGVQTPKIHKITVSAKIDVAAFEKMNSIAAAEDRYLSDLINCAVHEYVERRMPKSKGK